MFRNVLNQVVRVTRCRTPQLSTFFTTEAVPTRYPGGFNQLTLVGRAGRDPVANTTEDGRIYTFFPVAVNRLVGAEETSVLWFDVVVVTERAKRAVERVQKGDKVLVVGSIRRTDPKILVGAETLQIMNKALKNMNREMSYDEESEEEEQTLR